MPNEPSAGELLRAAHRSMKEKILPALPQDLRSEGAMIARVLAIVLAELNSQDDVEREIRRLWSSIYPDIGPAGIALPALEARIASDIRTGHFDAVERRASIEEALLKHAALQLAASNPRFVVQSPDI